MRATLPKTIGAVAVLFSLLAVQSVFGYYNPATGSWLSRDPVGEPGFQLGQRTMGTPRVGPVAALHQPNRWINRDSAPDGNLYQFIYNSPVMFFDPFGLDIWVVADADGLIRHRWAVGNNADGTYWSSDFMPTANNMFRRLNCRGQINFAPNGSFNPTNLTFGYVIERHTIVSQSATDAARDYAKKRAAQADQPRYDACGNNCIDWANGLAWFAIGRQIRENLDEIKNEKQH